MIDVGIIGATGYAGEELIEILLRHPEVRIKYLAAKIEKASPIDEIFPKFKNKIDVVCKPFNLRSALSKSKLLFLALPHTVSLKIVPKLLKSNIRIIDLSADYRLKNIKTYEKFYQAKHKDGKNLKSAVYGLPEIYRNKIKKAKLIANPGCYPTAAILSLAPLLACGEINQEEIFIDAKSGATGAGRRAEMKYFFSEINEDIFAYKINMHQHMPEINQELSKLATAPVEVTFVPHMLSVNRGILETIYVKQDKKLKLENKKLIALYKNFYKKEPFVRIKPEGESVHIKDVAHTNFCDISITSFPKQDLVIIVTAIDNLGKGAAGQAVQNMNIMMGFPEQMSLA
ncbi:MAG: N-acetyl-gamma-glutamyl-phosphate reductase [Candidatus Omnitrophica bacterium]|nr:N-acetyl-gamma-glutamyl-phosphate reductase [Candidatus Omnitrophota bacterium]